MISIGPRLFLRPATSDDEPFLRRLFDDVKGPAFAGLGEAAGALLDMQHRARQMGYQAQFPNLKTSIVQADEEPIGSVMVDEGVPLRLVDISILSSDRGKGYGTAVLVHLIGLAHDGIVLQVAHGNPAIHLYTRLGFQEVEDNGMDITMRRVGS